MKRTEMTCEKCEYSRPYKDDRLWCDLLPYFGGPELHTVCAGGHCCSGLWETIFYSAGADGRAVPTIRYLKWHEVEK